MNEEQRDALESQRQLSNLSERVDANTAKITALEDQADVDAKLIAALQAEGLLRQDHQEELQAALGTSRRVGAAIGILMASRGFTEDGAFNALASLGQNTNRKLRDIADELVATGDDSPFPNV